MPRGERGSYGGYIFSFDVFYASSFDVVITWWKYVERFKGIHDLFLDLVDLGRSWWP